MNSFPALILCAGLTVTLPLQVLAANVQLDINPLHSTVGLNDSTFVDVTATYDGTDKLLGGAFSLSFDNSVLSLVNVILKAPTDVAGTLGTVQAVSNLSTLTGVGFASFVGIGGSFTIASLEFKTLRGGVANLALVDAQDPVFTWASESLTPVKVQGTLGTISAVPEPASMALLLAGLGVVGTVASQRRRRSACLTQAAATVPQLREALPH